MNYHRCTTTGELSARVMPFVSMAVSFPVLVIAAYWIKSAMGIDLFEGPSFMHAYFYWG